MKAYVLDDIGKLEYRDVDIPQLYSGEALIEVKAAGICGSDIPRIFETGTYHFPTIPGHEFAGTVVDVHDGNDKHFIGKRVGVFPLMPCFECYSCKKKQYEMCSNYNYLGSRTDGGFAEYVKVPIWNLIEIPDSISFNNVAMLEPAAVALHAIRHVDIHEDNVVVIYGAGTIGLLCAMWLKTFGFTNVLIIGTNNHQKKLIDNNGLGSFFCINNGNPVEWIMEKTNNIGADIVMECVGSEESVFNAISSAASYGNVVLVGNPKTDISFPKNLYWSILRRQLRVFGTWNSSFAHDINDDWNTTISRISDNTFNPSLIVTHALNFDNLHFGLNIMQDKNVFTKKVLVIRQ